MKDSKEPTLDLYMCRQFIGSMAAIISNSLRNYWLSRSDATDAMNECYKIAAGLIKEAGRIELKIINSQFIINDVKLELTGSNTVFFLSHLQELEVQNFTMTSETDQEDFVKLLEIFEARPHELEQLGGFVDFVTGCALKGITSRKVIIKEITEEDVVINKKQLKSDTGTSGIDTANIVAFLKGQPGITQSDLPEDMAKTAADPARMAELIMQAVHIQQVETPIEGGETLVDFVVGCLRKTYSAMQSSKESRSKTGRKRITRNLLLLEEEIVRRMREMKEEWSEDDIDEITRTVNEMTDELMIDSIADEYVKQKQTIEKNEAQLLDYIKSKGFRNIEDITLKSRLMDKGLSLDGWNELVLKSGSRGSGFGSGPGSGAGGTESGEDPVSVPVNMPGAAGLGSLMDAISHLDTLLDSMDKQFTATSGETCSVQTDEALSAFTNVERQIDAAASDIRNGLNQLAEDIRHDADSAEQAEIYSGNNGRVLRRTRRELLSQISRIVQSITQPLCALATSLQMIESKSFGSVNTHQASIIRAARSNTERIKNLLEQLSSIGEKP